MLGRLQIKLQHSGGRDQSRPDQSRDQGRGQETLLGTRQIKGQKEGARNYTGDQGEGTRNHTWDQWRGEKRSIQGHAEGTYGQRAETKNMHSQGRFIWSDTNARDKRQCWGKGPCQRPVQWIRRD